MRTHSPTLDKSVEAALLNTMVKPSDVVARIKPGMVITNGAGQPLIVFGRFGEPHPEIKRFLPTLRYTKNSRLAGRKDGQTTGKGRRITNETAFRFLNRNFGYRPQRPVFNLEAGPCDFNYTYPKQYERLAELGREMQDLYEHWSPVMHQHQRVTMETVRDNWKIPGTFFTQGIINDTANMQYHYDRGNFAGNWSCMAVFARDVVGGELVVPALGLALAVEDETYVLFDGQALLHGVAPITPTGRYGKRYSIVYYAIERMRKYGTYDEELQHMREMDARKHARKLRGDV